MLLPALDVSNGMSRKRPLLAAVEDVGVNGLDGLGIEMERKPRDL
jgi:hypothetical protein